MTTQVGRIETLTEPKPTFSNLAPDEIKRLREISRQDGLWTELKSALVVGAGLGVVVFSVTFGLWLWLAPVENPAHHKIYFEILGVAAGLYVPFEVFRTMAPYMKAAKARTHELHRDAEQGFAHDLDLEITRVVEIEEYEDEGAGFFLELADGRVLCLISQDLYEYASDFEFEDGEEDTRGKFPQTRIRYRFAPLSGTCLDFTGIGETLRPFGKVKTTGRMKSAVPENGGVYEGPIEATLAGFKYKLKPV